MQWLKQTSEISKWVKQQQFHKIYSVTTLPDPNFWCEGKQFTSFSTNNYLGLAHHPEVIDAARKGLEFGVANTESRLLSGDLKIYHTLEEEIAKMKGKEAAMIFASGFLTNFSVLSSIPNIALNARMYGYNCKMMGKWVYFSDEFNHTSINVGISASRAKIVPYPHLDLQRLERLIEENAEIPNKLIITDSIFSVNGDICPLDKLLNLAEKYDAMIYVDDAHGTGVLGKNGAGIMSHFEIKSDRIIHMGTLSKAYGSIGGFIAANNDLIDLLRFVCSGYIFTSTIPQDQAYAIIAAIKIIKQNPQLIKNLWDNQKYFIKKMGNLPYQLTSESSPIVPILIGDEKLSDKFTNIIHENGLHVDSVKFPSVPYGKARLRVILNARHTKEQIDKLVAVLDKNKNLL